MNESPPSMPDEITQDEIDLQALYEMDKGTLSPSRKRRLLKNLKVQGAPYRPYGERVGPGLWTLASEVKRELDRQVLPAFLTALPRVTGKRFKQAFCDVRIYPQSHELGPWEGGDWAGATLNVLVSFVVSIPPDDSLDSMARMTALQLFEASPWAPEVKKLGKKGQLHAVLNVDALNRIMGEMDFEHFHPYALNGFSLEITIDGCPALDFERLAQAARGAPLQAKRSGKKEFLGLPGKITPDNAATEVPVLIAAISRELGVRHLNPRKLRPGDSLYALMGFDPTLTGSLIVSVTGHFNVLGMIGGNRMVTVGNAMEFAQDFSSQIEGE